jgi:hypothetical protein
MNLVSRVQSLGSGLVARNSIARWSVNEISLLGISVIGIQLLWIVIWDSVLEPLVSCLKHSPK